MRSMCAIDTQFSPVFFSTSHNNQWIIRKVFARSRSHSLSLSFTFPCSGIYLWFFFSRLLRYGFDTLGEFNVWNLNFYDYLQEEEFIRVKLTLKFHWWPAFLSSAYFHSIMCCCTAINVEFTLMRQWKVECSVLFVDFMLVDLKTVQTKLVADVIQIHEYNNKNNEMKTCRHYQCTQQPATISSIIFCSISIRK